MNHKRRGLGLAAGILALAAGQGRAAQAAAAPARPEVEVVFVLDTTGSMGGLLEGAKQKIWAIANEVAKGKPSPRVKMGLVAYRDKGDEYVSKVFDLSTNLDQTYKDLLSLSAGGGGDEPEHVLKGLEDAIERISWNPDSKTFKVVYLVGDAPPHENYGDTAPLDALLQKAVRRDLLVNAIQCGSNSGTTAFWQRISRLGEGKFLAIAQDGGMVAVATPFDEKLAEINRRLEGTLLAYGKKRNEAAEMMSLSGAVGEMASSPAAAERAVYKSRAGFSDAMDLAQAVENKAVSLDKMQAEELPQSLRGLSVPQRKAKLEAVLGERRQLRAELDAVASKRAAFLASRAKGAPKESFDAKLVESLKDQAARKGIAY